MAEQVVKVTSENSKQLVEVVEGVWEENGS